MSLVLGPGFSRILAPHPLSPSFNEKRLCSPFDAGTVFLEWAWAEEAQMHRSAVKWMTIHFPQRLAMSVRSMVTPNEAGNEEVQMKQMPPISR